jgi:Icc-related predicted phosphoesterase
MTKVRYFSDLHLDGDMVSYHPSKDLSASIWQPIVLDEDKETILIIAGDLWTNHRYLSTKISNDKSWMEIIADRFKHVIFVLGNHDYWGSCLQKEPANVKEMIISLNLKNVTLLEKDSIVIDEYKILGGTLWTSFNNGDFSAISTYETCIKDCSKIASFDGRNYFSMNGRLLLPIFESTKKFIFENAVKDNDDQKVIVVSHMAPSELSVHPRYKNSKDLMLNFSYHSELGNEIVDSQIDFWIHGHVHDPFAYEINNTKVCCNPRGYERFLEKTNYSQEGYLE